MEYIDTGEEPWLLEWAGGEWGDISQNYEVGLTQDE